MKVLGISCITNMVTGIAKEKHSYEEVLKDGSMASQNLCIWVENIVKDLKIQEDSMPKFSKNFNKLKEVENETPNKNEIVKAYKTINEKLILASISEEANKIIEKFFSFFDTVFYH